MTRVDVRDLLPSDRHPRIHEAFDDADSCEAPKCVDDHGPEPLFYEFETGAEDFDDGYEVTREGRDEFVARFPKR